MARYVDLDKLKEFDCDGIMCNSDGNCAECFYHNGGAEIYIAPVIHAIWETMYTEDLNNNIIEEICYCSNCKHRAISKGNEYYMLTEYCPFCGAKMSKE